jgi:hypothetical protein
MKPLLTAALLAAWPLAHADDLVRSAAYKASDAQARILSSSGAVIAEIDTLLDEMSRNGITDDTKEMLKAARSNLAGAREGSIAAALTQLREISTSGRSEDIQNVIQQQQAAEIDLRQIAAKIAEKQFTDEISASASAILARQDRVLALIPDAKNESVITAEQQAIALQVHDLVQALSSSPADLPASMATILKQASSQANSLGLTAKAEAATQASPERKARQKELRGAIAQVDITLSAIIPAKERLQKAVEAVAKMQKEQAKLAASQQPDSARSEALATQAGATARQIASESPAAKKALERAAGALQTHGQESQSEATAALAEAAAALNEQLELEKLAEQTSLADAAAALQKMADEAAALAAENAAAQSSTPASQESLATRAESLQSHAAPLVPDAAASVAEARKHMADGNQAAAAAEFQEASQLLAAQATAALSSATESASLEAMQAAINKASETIQASAESIKSKNVGEVAGKLLQSQDQFAQLAAQAALAAAESSKAGQKSSSALSEAAQATAQAAAASLESAQSAARGKLANAKQANARAAKSLAAASQALSRQQSQLRSQAGLPMSSNGPSGPSGSVANGEPPPGEATGHSEKPQQGFSAAVRQAMAELRQTPVPPEYSGSVRAYFEQLASE